MTGAGGGGESLSAYFEGQKEDIVRDIVELIRIPSVSGNRCEIARALGFLLALAAEMGFSARSVLDGQAGVVEYGEGEETVGILVHVDVVPALYTTHWRHDPFGGEIAGGEIWGRGALDDKGPAVSALYAMKAVRDLGGPVRKRIRYIIGTHEESDWADIKEYVKNFDVPDFGFTPDGEFPVGIVEEGSEDAIIVERIGGNIRERVMRIVCPGIPYEGIPAEATLFLVRDGRAMVITGDGAIFAGEAADRSSNAIIGLCRQMNSEDRSAGPASGMIRVMADRFEGERQAEPTLLEIKGSELLVSVHAVISADAPENGARKFFQELADDGNGTIAFYGRVPPVSVDAERPFIRILEESYEKFTGQKSELIKAAGGTYAKTMPNIVSYGPLFPGDADLCHSADERISIRHVMDLCMIYGEALRRIVETEARLK